MQEPPKPDRYAGLWFPTGLVFLLLLLVPGVVLILTSLFGGENAVNAWLQQHFNISYHLPLPLWATLVLLLLPLLVLLLYFLKMKRRPLQVPSTFLWRKSIEDIQVNSFFQWLRNNVLLLLQLAALLLLIYAIMAFQLHGSTTSGRYYILLIDNSASMATTDVSPNRLGVAKEQALNVIDAHSDGDFGMVIEFNSRARIRQTYTSDRALLRKAVERIEQTQAPTSIDQALAYAGSLANPLKSTEDEAIRPPNEEPGKERTYVPNEGLQAEVYLFSDGGFTDGQQFSAGNLELMYHRIGKPGPESIDNVGFVDFNSSRDEFEPTKLDIFSRIQNYRSTPVTVTVELEWRVQGADDFHLREVELRIDGREVTPPDLEKDEPGKDEPGEGVARFEIDNIDDTQTLLIRARLRGAEDSFPLDNEVWRVAGVIRKARVLIVTPGNRVLRKFFDQEATREVANVTYLRPEDLEDDSKYGDPAREGAYDLIVFDRCAPADVDRMPLSNTFFIDSVPPPWKRSEMPPLENVFIRNPRSDHPLMRHLSGLDEIGFSGAFRFEFDPKKDPRVPPKVPKLLETDKDSAVLFALNNRLKTDLVLAFPIVNNEGKWATMWSLQLSFPVFLRNVLYQLGYVGDTEENVRPGNVKVLRPDAAVDRIDVFEPGRATPDRIDREQDGEFRFNETSHVGIYRAVWDGGERSFAVNLLDETESNVQPRDMIQIGDQRVVADQPVGRPRDLWKWAALAVVGLLVIEWAFYHRRIFQ